jgi:hypothetical protein
MLLTAHTNPKLKPIMLSMISISCILGEFQINLNNIKGGIIFERKSSVFFRQRH